MFAFVLPLLVAAYLYWPRKRSAIQRSTLVREPIAVLVPLRNESDHFDALCRSLASLELEPDDEIILVDDASTKALSLENQPELKAKVIRREAATGSKKQALTMGIESTSAPWILSTDADCSHHPRWVETLRQGLKPSSRMIIGPVLIKQQSNDSWLQSMTVYESACLWGIAKQSLRWKMPMLCSGANLCFSKAEWESLGGYTSHLALPSGDDVLLLRDFFEASPEGIDYCDSPDAVVFTESAKTWEAWYQQRKRWISKTGHVRTWPQSLQALFVVLWMMAPVILLFWNPVALIVLWIVEAIWMQDECVRLNQDFSLPKYLAFRLAYPLLLVKLFWVKKQVWKP